MSKQAERDYARLASQKIIWKKPYNDPRLLREISFVLSLFQERFKTGSILDIGCGPGWTSTFLARAGYEVVGVDISDHMIEIAQKKSTLENVTADFFVGDMEELDLEGSRFEGVLFFDCLHHCPNYLQALKQAYQHLHPGGTIVLFETTWLHRYSPYARSQSEKYGITELGFSRRQLHRALTTAGFRNIQFAHDPGGCYQGLLGMIQASFRLWIEFFFSFPKMKNIVIAEKSI